MTIRQAKKINELKKYWETQKKNKLIRQLSNKKLGELYRACGGNWTLDCFNEQDCLEISNDNITRRTNYIPIREYVKVFYSID
jgi:hypothetical protein